MQKHAYLFMIHGDFESTYVCMSLLDDERNDIYIHMDKKTKEETFLAVKNRVAKVVKRSEVHYIKRRRVDWGMFNMVEVTIDLLREAIKGHYDYYHLLSGSDIPLQDVDTIHRFFEDNQGKEIISFNRKEISGESLKRIRYYYPKKTRGLWYRVFMKLQRKLNINRIRTDMIYQKGSNWFSITDELARYVVSMEKQVKKMFCHTRTSDEVFLQTLVMNSKFADRIYDKSFEDHDRRTSENTKALGNMRYLIWDTVSDGHPINLSMKNLPTLEQTKALFGRKFDWNQDSEIICYIYKKLKQKEWSKGGEDSCHL